MAKGCTQAGMARNTGDWAQCEDDELMQLAKDGAPEAFAALVRRHRNEARRFAKSRLGGTDMADDVVQNTFIEIYRYLPRYEARGKFKVFMYRVLTNQCRMVHRSARSSERALGRLPEPDASSAHHPEAICQSRELSAEVDRILDYLSPKLKEVLVHRFTFELSYREVAELLGVPLGTVKSRVASAIDRLRQLEPASALADFR